MSASNLSTSLVNRLQGTTTVSMYSFDHRTSSGKKIRAHLIDTPGFDDSERTDVQILQEIVFWLTQAYDNGFFLNGIVLLHDINAPKFAGPPKQFFEIFKALVGEKAYKAVYLAATFWDKACRRGKLEFDRASRRHDELEDEFWQPLIDAGAKLRLPPDDEDEVTSGDQYGWAREMVEHFAKNPAKHVLRIQRELSGQHVRVAETSAGKLAKDIWGHDDRHQAEVSQLKKTREELLNQWSAFLRDDFSKMKTEVQVLNQKLNQSYSNVSQNEYEELRKRKEEIDRAKMLKLASYGYKVQLASAGIGLGSLAVGGISAAAALAACSIM